MNILDFLENFIAEKNLVKEGYVNPTYPVGDPRYGEAVVDFMGDPYSLSPQRARTLELRRNMEYDRGGLQMYPGYDMGVDQIVEREKTGPYSYEFRY